MTTRCSQCKCEKLNNLFSIRANTGRQYKTCKQCRSKSYKCTQCDYKFGDKGNLKKHIKAVHDKIKDFDCKLCHAEFGRKSHLDRHIKTVHNKIKDFDCKLCDYKCGFKDALDRHIKTVHEGLKPHECKLCDYKCGQKSNLDRHIETVHEGLKPHECTQCDYKCGTNSGLTKHIKTCTGNRRGTSGECAVMDILDKMRVSYIHDSTYEVKDTNLLRWDFQILFEEKLIGFIEYDGRQHFEAVEHWGGQQALLDTQRRDDIKNDYCQKNNYLLLRIPYTEFANISDIVCDWIVDNTDWGFE